MMDIFLFLGIVFLLTFLIGRLIEKIRIPWIFAALLIGFLLAIYNPFNNITSSSTFEFLAQLGMYFLLFIIGFEIDLNKLKKSKKFIFKATFFIIFFEAVFGTLLIHFVFRYSWLISSIVALSFATVGEAILVPILDEFKIINTKLGQTILGVGTFDDLIEVFLLILTVALIGSHFHSKFNLSIALISLITLIILTIILTKLKTQGEKFKFYPLESLFLFVLFILFLFLGIGQLADSSPLAALLAGIALNMFLPKNRVEKIKSATRILCYGFFAPIFFLWVGVTIDINYLIASPLLVLLVVAVSKISKLLASWIVGKKEIGTKKSILLGIGLSVRFSTSIIIIKILFENHLIRSDLYSIIIASSIIFKFLVPVLFSYLIVKWKINKNNP